MDDKEKMREINRSNHYFRLKQEKDRLRDRMTRQDARGVVISQGNETVIVSIEGQRNEGRKLSNANYAVGEIVPYFSPSDSATGFAQRMTVG
jgi:hypothetical protein